MSSNLQILTKWLPLALVDHAGTFGQCKRVTHECLVVIVKVAELNDLTLNQFKLQQIPLKEIQAVSISLDTVLDKFTQCFRNIQQPNVHPLLQKKFKIFKQILSHSKLQLCYVLQDFIGGIGPLFVDFGDDLLAVTLRLCTSYNNLLSLDSTFNLAKNSNSVCNNTCPYLLFPLKKMSVTKLLQILSTNRAEHCCHRLIDCLLETYKQHENSDDDNSSDNSSVEIYMALTKHLSPPIQTETKKETTNPDMISFTNLEELIESEEANVLKLLKVAENVAPNMLGKDGVRRTKEGGAKMNAKIIQKVLDYYEQILWAEVGNYLEHVILWWACSPLSARSPRSSQHLREWILHFVPTADVPSVILSALTSLADALGVHVTTTLWDQCFRQALVSSKTCNPDTGQYFCNVLQELMLLNNLCEMTPDWIMGAPLDELPLVEQIPVLHRLDHSIHTTRLWSINETRKLANRWSVKAFFAITHADIVSCLSQLNDLKLTDHADEIAKGKMAVHVEVCALMRAKLVSEVKVNVGKLKEAPNECVDCLASICKVINLANLQMIFPPKNFWKINSDDMPECADSYVDEYLEKMLSPVLKSTDNDVICNMILRLTCESWLDHIYMKKIKFSQYGALQLLCDFAYVSLWLQDCTYISEEMRGKLIKNEVLRRCEGVGRLLLRCPGERLRMVEKKYGNIEEGEEQTQQMPAEMYVPNQEQWLELRAMKRKSVNLPFCC